MKNLKYIKLFEAFESQKLSKTLGFINKSSRTSFIDDLKKLCNRLDFPISKLNDDFFLYLPFKKALNLVAQKSDTPCDATSEGQFPEHGIEDEVCQGGKMKRKWGERVREVAQMLSSRITFHVLPQVDISKVHQLMVSLERIDIKGVEQKF